MGCDENRRCRALSGALSQSLETLAFVEILPLGENAPPEAEMIDIYPRNKVYWATIPIVKPNTGSLTVILSEELCSLLTEQIYGFIEDEITMEMLQDAVAELANVVSGRFLDAYLEGAHTFELDVPIKGVSDSEDEIALGKDLLEKLDYAVEGHKLTVILTGEGFEK